MRLSPLYSYAVLPPSSTRVCALTLSLISLGMASIHPAARAADPVELEAIAVHAETERADGPVEGYRATRSATATRTDTPIKEIPRAISVIPTEVLEDLGEERIDRALDFAGGVMRSGDFGGINRSYNIRGFGSGGMLRNGFANNRGYNTPADAATVERIEVLKGPDSGLFGKGEPGGLINIVTKRPQAEAFTRFRFSAGRWDRYRGSADINTPLSKDGSMLARFNVAYEDNDSFRDYHFNQRLVLAPSFSWQISPDTKLTLDGEFLRNKSMFDFGILAYKGNLDVIPITNFYGDPTDKGVHNKTGTLQAGLEHALNADWKLRLAVQYYRGHMSSRYSYHTAPRDSAPELVMRSYVKREWVWHNRHYQLDLQGKFALLGWQHQVLIGAEYENHRTSNQEDYAAATPAYGINIWRPIYDKPIPAYTRYTNSVSREESWAVNLQDQIHMTDRLITTVGGRYERITPFGKNNLTQVVTSDYTRDAFVPRVGLLYKLTPEVNVFTNASRSFKPNGVKPSTGEAYAPEKGVGYEIGAKFDLLDGRLGATLAAFHITKQNVLTTNPDDPDGDRITVGEQRSQGVDLQVSGKVTRSLRLIAGYAYINAKVTKDNNRPTNTTGNRLAGVPWHSGSLFAVYSFDHMELGGSFTYMGARRGSNSSTFESPSYRMVDLFTRWQATDQVHVTLNLNNVFNKRYYPRGGTSSSMPGDPRNLKMTVSVEL